MSSEERDAGAILLAAASLVLKTRPDMVSLFACGSYVNRPGPLVSDIDFIALAAGQPATSADEVSLCVDNVQVNITTYSEDYFYLVASQPDLFFYNLRDVRKLICGKLLYDLRGRGADVVALLRSVEVDGRIILSLLSSVQQLWQTEIKYFTIDNNRAIDLLAFVIMHSRRDILYSKHKYMLEDAKRFSGSLSALLCELAERTVTAVDVRRVADGLSSGSVARFGEEFGGVKGVLEDAKTLLLAGREPDAVFPLRYVSLTFAQSLSLRGNPDDDFSSVAQVLLLGTRIPDNIRMHFSDCFASTVREISLSTEV